MIELLAGAVGILAVLLVVAVVYAVTYRQERDDVRRDLKTTVGAVEILENRVTVLRGDIRALDQDKLRLASENTDLQRENGRFAAEIRQLKQEAAKRTQPRDPATGRMLPNPNAKRPRKSRAKTAPIACG